VQQRVSCRDIRVEQLAEELHVDGQRDEMLLHAVMELAFDPAAFGVGRGGDVRARYPQRFDLTVQLVGGAVDVVPPRSGLT
jgi:hypothetical protein